jgi:hypothetical protein
VDTKAVITVDLENALEADEARDLPFRLASGA